MCTITLPATSGDATLMLQRAIDALQFGQESGQMGTVLLSGDLYRIESPIVSGGDSCTNTLAPVAIGSLGHAVLDYQGSLTDDYVCRSFGNANTSSPRLFNVTVKCNGKARGLLLVGHRRTGNFVNVQVHHSRQVGVDLIDCWSSRMDNLRIKYAGGYAVRASQWNSSVANCWHISSDAGEWPAADDTYAVDCQGNPFRTEQQCCVWVGEGNGAVFTATQFEGCKYSDLPLIFLRQQGSTWINTRFEGNVATGCKVVIDGRRGNGRQNVFAGVVLGDGKKLPDGSADPNVMARSFFRCEGASHYNEVRHLFGARALSVAIIDEVAGGHVGNRCRDCEVTNPVVNEIATGP